MAESFSRQKSRHAPQKEGGLKILCDLPPVWPRLVRPTNLMSRMDGKKTHTHTHTHNTYPRKPGAGQSFYIRLLAFATFSYVLYSCSTSTCIIWCMGYLNRWQPLQYSSYHDNYITGLVSAISRGWTLSVRNCVTRCSRDWPGGGWRFRRTLPVAGSGTKERK